LSVRCFDKDTEALRRRAGFSWWGAWGRVPAISIGDGGKRVAPPLKKIPDKHFSQFSVKRRDHSARFNSTQPNQFISESSRAESDAAFRVVMGDSTKKRFNSIRSTALPETPSTVHTRGYGLWSWSCSWSLDQSHRSHDRPTRIATELL